MLTLRFLPRRVSIYSLQLKHWWCAHRLNIWKYLSGARYCRRPSPFSDPAPDVGLHLCWMTMTHPDILAFSPESDINLNVSSYSTVISIFNLSLPHSPCLLSEFLLQLVRWLLITIHKMLFFREQTLYLLLWTSGSLPAACQQMSEPAGSLYSRW